MRIIYIELNTSLSVGDLKDDINLLCLQQPLTQVGLYLFKPAQLL